MARDHRLLRSIERLLVVAGVAALTWCAFVLTESALYQHAAYETLNNKDALVEPFESPTPAGAPPEVMAVPVGTPMAALEIPRLHLSAAVLEGSDDHTLRRGPGHIEHTAWPGQPGNVGIAGHRDTFFRPLQDAQVGDEILLDTPRGRSLYRVSFVRVVPPDDVSVLDPTRNPTLTLVTCYPFSFVGPAPMRFIVRAERVSVDQPLP